ncbi:MAG: NAD(P)H-binding protein [Actinobacteria bacterium]|nr:NAD(P)H-binding protein [Actinomycetota bacterium]
MARCWQADSTASTQLLVGADVVVSALGPTSKDSDLHTRTAAALIPAMQQAGVSRYVGISGAGIDVTGDQKGLRDKIISFLVQRLGAAMAADKAHEYRAWAASDRDWTLVRPPRLTDQPPTGKIYIHAHRPGPSSRIPRADLAHAVASIAESQQYRQQAPFVSAA